MWVVQPHDCKEFKKLLMRNIFNSLLVQPFALFIGILLLSFNACVWEKGDLSTPLVQCDTTTITFRLSGIDTIFALKCGPCHTTQSPVAGGLNFNSYADVKEKIDDGRIQIVALGSSPTMPFGGPFLHPDTIARINEWISAGGCE
ncbi:MAG: hypothetical protein COB85_03320 [Bacteroidetes bacterium]|nr:MAG: hypothetical protein COB85_03320 [Bacteroidota bacterium]